MFVNYADIVKAATVLNMNVHKVHIFMKFKSEYKLATYGHLQLV